MSLAHHLASAYDIVSKQLIQNVAAASDAHAQLADAEAAFKRHKSSPASAAAFHRADVVYTAAVAELDKVRQMKHAIVMARIKCDGVCCGVLLRPWRALAPEGGFSSPQKR